MNLLPTTEQIQIIDAVASFMAERLPVSRYRQLADDADQVTPRLLIPMSRMRPPVPVCRGTKPNQAANSRPDLKALASPIILIQPG